MPLFPLIANHPETCVEYEPYNEKRIKNVKDVLFDKTMVFVAFGCWRRLLGPNNVDLLGDIISMMHCL